ncbi:MAG: FtsX-like permease family protein [Myxococcota bacterium]
MPEALAVLPSASGGLALVFIVALAMGIAGLGLIFIGSAVVVLERLARMARRTSVQAFAGAIAAGLATIVVLELEPSRFSSGFTLAGSRSPLATLFLALLSTGVAILCVRLLLVRVSEARLAGTGFGLVVLGSVFSGGSAGLPFWAASVALFTAGLLAVGALRRRGKSVTRWEVGLRILLISAVLAAGIGILPEVQREWIGTAGFGILSLLGLLVMLGLLPLAMAGLVDTRGTAEWFIAIRYLVARRRQVFISVITAICVVGIASGVWLILVVLSVMNGFEETWREEILGHRAHFIVHTGGDPIPNYAPIVAQVQSVPGVIAVSPFLDAEAMVRGSAGEIHGLRLRGIDPDRVSAVTRLDQDLIQGSLEALEWPPGKGQEGDNVEPPILIGNRLASALGIDVEESLLLIAPFGGTPTPLGPAPRLMRFTVAGVFRSSFHQYDETYAYVSLPAAQDFRRAGAVIDGIEVITPDYYRSRQVGRAVDSALGAPFQIRDWKDYFPAFFQALKTERVMMFLLLSMVMVVAAFVIVATLMMMIMEKSSDIAILKAMGAEDSLIERIFALEGTLIGLAGTFLGVVAALAVTNRIGWIQDRIESITGVDALPETVYQFSSLPSRVDTVQVLIVVGIALILSLGATLLPSRQGAGLDPAEGLRHE